MKVVIFSEKPFSGHMNIEGALRKEWADLESAVLEEYDAVCLIGSQSLDYPLSLSMEVCSKLWAYAEKGGLVYAEMIEAFDFPTSRLLGWKQDFPATRRTMEKLRASRDLGRLKEGALLEWGGAMQQGFSFESEVLLSFGPYGDTHHSVHEAESARPAINVRKLGEGTVVYAAFSLFSSPSPEQLRPYSSWAMLLEALSDRTGLPCVIGEPSIKLAGDGGSEQALACNMRWFERSGILPVRDGSEGVFENIHSVTAKLSKDRRPDCHAHTALMFHLYGRWSGDATYEERSYRLMDYLFREGYQDMDPDSESYGFFKWYQFPGAHPHQIFTDDNAWACFVLLYLARSTGREEYRRRGILLAQALLDTQRRDGLRPNVLIRSEMKTLGREGVLELEPSLNPHFESITHAAYIQAYLVTEDEMYLDAALTGTRTLLAKEAAYKFMYSRTSGLTRLLLPLGYLIGHDGTGEIEAALNRTMAYLMEHRHASGGIEEADNPDPQRFGKEDAGVYIANGEGIADQLYTNNFLLMNSWEAWKATGNPAYKELYDDVSAFMRSIQISSEDKRYDGGWMRAFDLNKREYFGNNGDTGWGPYCMESGWTNAIASAGLLLGLLDESLFA
ncbi:hypothetical protein [Paenibacillus chungangensis]|uniref:Uncharacterized protein n=1 Tax=Paenibacillus chungangensis TaxID=696535 RepID=A0ABW3HRF4_9BACL